MRIYILGGVGARMYICQKLCVLVNNTHLSNLQLKYHVIHESMVCSNGCSNEFFF